NQEAVQKAIAQAQASLRDLRTFLPQAEQYLSQIEAARGQLAQSQADLHQLRQLVDSLAPTLRQSVGIISGLGGLLPGGLSQQVSTLSQQLDALQSNVDELDRLL